MLTSFQNLFFNKMTKVGRSEQLYIIPTLDGLKLLALNLILLIIGLVYANNYILLFNFILFCLFLGSMYYTHFNLQGLRLISARATPVHLGDAGILTLSFKSTSNLGHFFLGLRVKDLLIEVENKAFTFSFQSRVNNTLKIDIPIRAIKRGCLAVEKICVETLFPFHLFRCFVYFNPQLNLIVLPQKRDLKIHLAQKAYEEKYDEGDDFILTDFKLGDPLKRIHWKKLAQTNRWYSKSLIAPMTTPVMLSLIKDPLIPNGPEDQLSSLCSALYQCHYDNISYGLTLGDKIIAPNHSQAHLANCLRELAKYEN